MIGCILALFSIVTVSRDQSFKMKFSWLRFYRGVEFPVFLLIFAWALQPCSATTLPVISAVLHDSLSLVFIVIILCSILSTM